MFLRVARLAIFVFLLSLFVFPQSVRAQSTTQKACGINIDFVNPAAHPEDPSVLEGLGWVRFVFNVGKIKAGDVGATVAAYEAYVNALSAQGTNIIMVLNQETYYGDQVNNWQSGDFAAYARGYGEVAGQVAKAFNGKVDAYEIWNEPDLTGEFNAPITGGELNMLVEAAGPAIHKNSDAQVVLGGFGGGGDAKYFSALSEFSKSQVDGIGTHPYGKEPSGTRGSNTLETVHMAGIKGLGKPIWITEFANSGTSYTGGGGLGGTDDQAGAAEYIADFYSDIEKKYNGTVQAAILFGWSDKQDERDEFGLYDEEGKPKEKVIKALYEVGCQAEVKFDKNPSTSTDETDAKTGPVLIYPTKQELEYYVANMGAYCAPQTIRFADLQGETPPLQYCNHASLEDEDDGPGKGKIDKTDGVCTQFEYPIIHNTESWNLGNASAQFSFPLFRDQEGGISIEADLSRVKPKDTFYSALNRNVKPDYAPQFYLTSPETQCLNAVRYLKYVKEICSKYGSTTGECAQNTTITMPDDSKLKLLDSKVQTALGDEAVCQGFSKDVAQGTERALLVRSIAPQTPKVFKLGFLVQHVYSHKEQKLVNEYYMKQWFADWFTTTKFPEGGNNSPKYQEHPGEQLLLFPIWYNAGLAVNEYDQYETEHSYSFDPLQVYKDGTAEIDVTKVEDNFVGPWLRAYQAVLAPHVQDEITRDRKGAVWSNWKLMKEALAQLGNPEMVLHQPRKDRAQYDAAVAYKGDPIIDCWNENCLCFDDEAKRAARTGGIFQDMAAPPADQCPNQTVQELKDALPNNPNIPIDEEYLKALKELIVARINSGVQTSWSYDPNKPESQITPVGVRQYGPCGIDQTGGIKLGESETADQIVANGIQEGVKTPYTEGKTEWNSKIIPGGLKDDPKKSSYTYLLLPEEASNIEITQGYITPMFLSQQAYTQIISGVNPAYPFAEKYTSQGEEAFMSAYLRTKGYTAGLSSIVDGYKWYIIRENHHKLHIWSEDGQEQCEDEGIDSYKEYYYKNRGNPQEKTWVPANDVPGLDGNPCFDGVTTEISDKGESLVRMKDRNGGDTPNPSPQTPGKLAAIHEYFRRMAFTPLHMQPFKEYPGLEKFYLSSGTQTLPGRKDGDALGNPDGSGSCVYDPPRQMTTSVNSNEELEKLICTETGGDVELSALIRAIWQTEGGDVRNLVKAGGGTYECGPNYAGAIPPMQITIGVCSDTPSETRRELNTTVKYDLCTIEDSISYVSNEKVRNNLASVRSDNQGASLKMIFALTAQKYVGTPDMSNVLLADRKKKEGFCGDYGIDGDGTIVADNKDYCGFVAQAAMDFMDNMRAAGCQ